MKKDRLNESLWRSIAEHCSKCVNEKQKEIEQLNELINELNEKIEEYQQIIYDLKTKLEESIIELEYSDCLCDPIFNYECLRCVQIDRNRAVIEKVNVFLKRYKYYEK